MKQPFYTKFVDENKMRSIFCKKEQNRYWEYTAGLFFFSEAVSTFPMLVGWNVKHPFGLLIIAFDAFSLLLLLHFCAKFIHLEKRCNVFKKKTYMYFFLGGYLLLGVAFGIVQGFTTKFTSYSDFSFEINVNLLFYITVYAPTFLTFAIFCHYAFTKLFAKIFNENTSMIEKTKIRQKTNSFIRDAF